MSVLGEGKGTKAKEPEGTRPERTIMVGEIDKNLKYKSIEPFAGDRNKGRRGRGGRREQLNATLVTEPTAGRGGYAGTM